MNVSSDGFAIMHSDIKKKKLNEKINCKCNYVFKIFQQFCLNGNIYQKKKIIKINATQ